MIYSGTTRGFMVTLWDFMEFNGISNGFYGDQDGIYPLVNIHFQWLRQITREYVQEHGNDMESRATIPFPDVGKPLEFPVKQKTTEVHGTDFGLQSIP